MLDDFRVYKLDEQTFLLDDYFGIHCYLLIGREKALLIDSGIGIGNLRTTTQKLTSKEIILVNTHAHLDHIGCNYQFMSFYLNKSDVELYKKISAKENRSAILPGFCKEMDSEFPEKIIIQIQEAPSNNNINLLNNGHIFDLGKRTVEVIETPGHTKGSICLLDVEKKWLYTNDSVCDESVLLCFPESATIQEYEESLFRLWNRRNEFRYLYPGHHQIPLSPNIIEDYLTCIQKIMNKELIEEIHSSAVGIGRQVYYKGIGLRI